MALAAVVTAAALVGGAAGPAPVARADYTAGSVGEGSGLAQLVPSGNTPEASAVGRDMTVTWTAVVPYGRNARERLPRQAV